jgi:hypothetical protein
MSLESDKIAEIKEFNGAQSLLMLSLRPRSLADRIAVP